MVVYLVVLTAYYFPEYKKENEEKGILIFDKYESDLLINMQLFGVFIFIFCSMTTYHQAFRILKKPTFASSFAMSAGAIMAAFAFFLIFALLAYFSFGPTLKQDKFELFPSRPQLEECKDNDIPNTILKGILVGSLSINFLAVYLPMKDNLVDVFKIDYSFRNNLIMVLSSVTFTSLLSYGFP